MSETVASACAWHLAMHPPQLVPLDGTTADAALLALANLTLSHGICEACADALYAARGLRRPA